MLYEDAETAKSVADEYTDDPPMFVNKPLDVKLYREPVQEIPKGMTSSAIFSCTIVITVSK